MLKLLEAQLGMYSTYLTILYLQSENPSCHEKHDRYGQVQGMVCLCEERDRS